jgi:virginiamycin B lyase
MMPDDRARDPHTLVFDSKGGIWFTVQGENFVGHLQKETGEVRLVEMPQAQTPNGLTSSRPYGIKLDAQGVPWIVLFNTNKIVSVDPQNLAVRAFELPEGARPRRLEITADQMVWYVDYAQGRLSRLDPSTGEVKEWPTPGGERSRPYGMAKDHLDRLWFVESGIRPNRFVGFNPRTETFFSSQELESGGGTVRHMFFDQATRAVWFGTDTNTVGRAIIPG